MLDVPHVRALGVEGLTELLSARPQVLEPSPPRSIGELVARLDHPVQLSIALGGLDLPALEVGEALAALGVRADRPELERLVGVSDAEGRAAVDRALASLEKKALLEPGAARLTATLEQGWPQPLGLGRSLHEHLSMMSLQGLTAVLRAWGVQPGQLRKQAAMEAAWRVLTDGDRVRRMVGTAPEALRDRIVDLALRGGSLPEWSWRASGRRPTVEKSTLTWAQGLMLVVRGHHGELEVPAEVALALRGPDWHAPFTPNPPALAWRPVPETLIEAEAGPAGAQAVRGVDDFLRFVAATPLTLVKNGSVGARELRRAAKAVGVPVERVRMMLALTHHLDLVAHQDDSVAIAPAGQEWLQLSPAPALALLVDGWSTLPELPLDYDELPWVPTASLAIVDLRGAVLRALAERPGSAPGSADELATLVAWHLPTPLGRPIGGSRLESDGQMVDDETFRLGRSAFLIGTVLTEASWLGVVADGALAPAGRAVVAGVGPVGIEAALGSSVGTVEHVAVLQADLTATVLGHPSGSLVTTLDGLAERESRSAATVWRFTPASIRRALDDGATASALLAELARASASPVPQALSYLVQDVARRYGLLRAGSALSYLRSDDVALLAEVAADRRLRRHGLLQLAPTVLVSSSSSSELIEALRAAGHGPVAEGPDGTPVLTRRSSPTAAPPPHTPASAGGDLAEVAARLLEGPDRPGGRLLDLGDTVIEARSLGEYANSSF